MVQNFTWGLQGYNAARKYYYLIFAHGPYLDPKSHGWSHIQSMSISIHYCGSTALGFACLIVSGTPIRVAPKVPQASVWLSARVPVKRKIYPCIPHDLYEQEGHDGPVTLT